MTRREAPAPHAKNQLHGVTLEVMINDLVAFFGWEELGQRIPIRCFNSEPSVPSSLKFLRKTPWARAKVEGLFLFVQRERSRRLRRAAGDEPEQPVDVTSTESEALTAEEIPDDGTVPERG